MLKTASRPFITASHTSAAVTTAGPPAYPTAWAIPRKTPAAAALTAGPATAIRRSAPASEGSPSSSVNPPSIHSVIARTFRPLCRATSACQSS